MINILTMTGFIDEMEKIAFMSNVGNAIRQTGRFVGRHVQGAGANIGTTLQKTFTNPIQATREGFQHTIKSSLSGTPGQKAFGVAMLGLQGAQTYSDVKGLGKDDPTGKGRGERIGNIIGSTAGGFIGAPHGLTGGIVGGEVARRGLGAVGKGVDKVIAMRRKKPEHVPMPQGQVQE